jgi:hypothetical protein
LQVRRTLTLMNMQTAVQLGEELAADIQDHPFEAAYARLAPVLAERTPFRYLERIGEIFGAGTIAPTNIFIAQIAAHKTEGGWVVIGGALRAQLGRDLGGAFERARTYIIAADVWYGADILGERVPGPGLITHFEGALRVLSVWRDDPNRWVRRAVGVGVHFWAKRSRGAADLLPQASALLDLLEPVFGEWDMDAAKGVGWGLKTLGKYYPNLVAEWLPHQMARPHRAIVAQKAKKFLGERL